MSQSNPYIFIPSFSLEPNKLTSFNSVFIRDFANETIRSVHELKRTGANKFKEIRSENVIKRQSHQYTISDNAHRTLKRRINWLYYLAKSKSVKTSSGKSIYNFKIGFITLTLPSKQRTPTADVTKNLLNNFLTEIRQKTSMANYIWRLEFQKNGNVHYHIVTDVYLDYKLILLVWNRILKLNGYITDYQAKFTKLNLSAYNKKVNPDGKTDFSVIAKRFAKGKASNWEQPPSVDVKSVISNKAISNYISKYFSKDNADNPIKNELDTPENSSNLRLWFCSRSLSQLKTVTNFCEAVDYDIFAIVSYASKTRKVYLQYATCIFFEIKEMAGSARKWLEMILKDYSKKQGYIPAT